MQKKNDRERLENGIVRYFIVIKYSYKDKNMPIVPKLTLKTK